MIFRRRAVVFRWRAVVGGICPTQEHAPRRRPPDTAHGRKNLPRAETFPTAKASRHGARAKGFAPRGSRSPHGPTNGGPPSTDEQPEKHPFGGVAPETAHERKDLSRAGTLPTAKASRHGTRAKGFAPRRNTPNGEDIPKRRTGERICPAQKRSPRRRPPDTAHERKDLCRARRLSSAKASRHGARAKGFVPRRNTPHGEGLPTRRTGERICPAQERSPRRKPPDTARRRRDLPRTGTRPSAKASRHGARAKGFAPRERSPRRRPPDTARERKDLPRARRLSSAKASRHGARAKEFAPREFALAPRADERRAALGPQTARKTPLRRGRTRDGAAAAEFIHRKKIRLLHEIQLFYGESHVGSRQIFSSFPSVDRCVAQERNPVPPVAPHRGSEHRGLRRDGEMCHGFDEMVRRFDECPHGGELLPRAGNAWLLGGGRYCPGLRCFGERFHRRRCANPDACRAPRCSHG